MAELARRSQAAEAPLVAPVERTNDSCCSVHAPGTARPQLQIHQALKSQLGEEQAGCAKRREGNYFFPSFATASFISER